VGRGARDLPHHGRLEAQHALPGRVATGPAARRSERHDRPRPSARGQLQRDPAAERVAGEVRQRKARPVHRALDLVGDRRVADLALDRRPAGVARERQREDVVAALERREDELPRAPGLGEAVQAHERRPGACAVRCGEPA
jgi:hypothetical protein